LCETVSFGEKRFAAVVEFEDRRFLIGGASNSVSLLAELPQASFANALSHHASVTPEAK
jgi:flagellar biogenesis protein FliO